MTIERFYELMDRAYDLPHSPEQVALLEEAVRLADSLHGERAGFEARMKLIDAAEWSGFDQQAIVAFSWCLAYMDSNPDEVDEHAVMWRYKWILCDLRDNDAVSKPQILRMVDDFKRRCQVFGCSIRSAHYLRWRILSFMGELDEALPSYELWQKTPRDQMSDCAACELDNQICFKMRFGAMEEAVELAKPILSGKLTCNDVPAFTYAMLLEPLMKLGRVEESRNMHVKGYRLVANNGHYLAPLTDHLLYLTAAGDMSKAMTVFKRHLPLVAASRIPFRRFFFFLAAWRLMEKILQTKGSYKTRKLSVPRELSCYREDDTYNVGELADWFADETRKLADRFNHRNGNDYFSEMIGQNTQAATYRSSH